MYWIIVASIIIFSMLTVTTRRVNRAATYLLFTLFATAGLCFKLDPRQFLGAVADCRLRRWYRRTHCGILDTADDEAR